MPYCDDHHRSLQLADFSPLLAIPNIRLISLQKEDVAGNREASGKLSALVDLTHDLRDLADTAALVANLDLVISADTAVAHLAGGLGKTVWTLLPFAPDWRWMLGRDDSPWYPTMRLFRQPSPGDWGSVMATVCEALSR